MMNLRMPVLSISMALAMTCSLLLPASANKGTPKLQANDSVVFAGDSITHLGIYATDTLGWIEQFKQVAESKFSGLKIYGSGIPGDTSKDLLARFSNSVLNVNPSVVVIWIGINDVDTYTPAATTHSNISQMITQALKTASVREVILVSPECYGEKHDGQNPNDGAIDSLASWMYQTAIADTTGKVYYCPMRADWAYEEALLNTGDAAQGILTLEGLHPNVAGHAFLRSVYLTEFGLSNSILP